MGLGLVWIQWTLSVDTIDVGKANAMSFAKPLDGVVGMGFSRCSASSTRLGVDDGARDLVNSRVRGE